MTQLKPIDHLVNLDAAIALVERTPARMVSFNTWSSFALWRHALTFTGLHRVPSVEQLAHHSWGAKACLGGLLPADPYFKALGVKRDESGRPMMFAATSEHSKWNLPLRTFDLAEHLFGDRTLFSGSDTTLRSISGAHRDVGENDKERALHRLRVRRAKVLKQIEAIEKAKLEPVTVASLTRTWP